MRIKISELKKLIRERVKDILTENNQDINNQKIGPSGSYRWKEAVMQAVQDSLSSQTNSIHSQEDFQKAIDLEIEKIRGDVEMTLSMVARTLYQIPYQIFKSAKKINS
jgi:endonuclease III-like uncharacterized protein